MPQHIFDSTDEVLHQLADFFVAQAHEAVAARGRFSVALSGGSSPKKLYELLASPAYRERVPWAETFFFFGDERNVPSTDPDSNEGQAREALLGPVGVPEDNIHGFDLGAISMEHAAQAYEGEIREFAPEGFDLHLLGMGPEGHINSIFPHSEAVYETEDFAVPVHDSPKPPAERVTLTYPAVNRSQRVWLLVSGEQKAEAAAQLVAGAAAEDWPAAGAHGTEETVLFLTDDAAEEL